MAKNIVKIKCTGAEERSVCPAGYKGGEEWLYSSVTGEPKYDWDIKPKFCDRAFHDIYMQIVAVQFNVNFPWRQRRGTELSCCSASCTLGATPVLFELEKLD
jgi:uncharacterized repeat protein (TIGR04076 family)